MLVTMLVAEVKYRKRALSGWIFLLLPSPFAKVLLSAKNFLNALSWASEMGKGFLITVHLIPSTQGGWVRSIRRSSALWAARSRMIGPSLPARFPQV
jgi:hypothetical protein